MTKPRSLICALMIGALSFVAGCSKPDSPGDAVAQVNAACQRVRDANAKLADLHLDDKAADVANDPKVKAALDESVQAAQALADQLDAAAAAQGGALGQLRRAIVSNRAVIRKAAQAALEGEKQSILIRIRLAKKVADLAGADACAGTN